MVCHQRPSGGAARRGGASAPRAGPLPIQRSVSPHDHPPPIRQASIGSSTQNHHLNVSDQIRLFLTPMNRGKPPLSAISDRLLWHHPGYAVRRRHATMRSTVGGAEQDSTHQGWPCCLLSGEVAVTRYGGAARSRAWIHSGSTLCCGMTRSRRIGRPVAAEYLPAVRQLSGSRGSDTPGRADPGRGGCGATSPFGRCRHRGTTAPARVSVAGPDVHAVPGRGSGPSRGAVSASEAIVGGHSGG